MIKTDLEIDWGWVKEILFKKEGIAAGSPGAVLDSADESIDKARRLARPKAIFTKKAVLSYNTDSIKLAGGAEFSGKTISSYIKPAQSIYIFLVTIGPAIENEASRLMKTGESLSGYLLDRASSFAVESLADKLENHLRKEYRSKDKSVSMRLSPGYCDWPIEEQAKFDRMLDFSKIGVRLTESYMMIPQKSISGLIGIGPMGLFSNVKSQCEICNMKKDCGYRRV
ncbi:MAG: hypothetical protein NTY76_06135 [Candidatus Omnitrophica bacterium]|nr:hypothetical protein [Candidatus Omnitrophota bacterium]